MKNRDCWVAVVALIGVAILVSGAAASGKPCCDQQRVSEAFANGVRCEPQDPDWSLEGRAAQSCANRCSCEVLEAMEAGDLTAEATCCSGKLQCYSPNQWSSLQATRAALRLDLSESRVCLGPGPVKASTGTPGALYAVSELKRSLHRQAQQWCPGYELCRFEFLIRPGGESTATADACKKEI